MYISNTPYHFFPDYLRKLNIIHSWTIVNILWYYNYWYKRINSSETALGVNTPRSVKSNVINFAGVKSEGEFSTRTFSGRFTTSVFCCSPPLNDCEILLPCFIVVSTNSIGFDSPTAGRSCWFNGYNRANL